MPADVSSEFTKAQWTADHSPLPCTPSEADPDTQIKPTELKGTTLFAAAGR